MSNYYQGGGGGGGCFGETSTVLVLDSAGHQLKTLVTQVKMGDKVATSKGVATVRCVVRIARDASKPLL